MMMMIVIVTLLMLYYSLIITIFIYLQRSTLIFFWIDWPLVPRPCHSLPVYKHLRHHGKSKGDYVIHAVLCRPGHGLTMMIWVMVLQASFFRDESWSIRSS